MALSATLCLLSILAGSGFGRSDFSASLQGNLRGVVIVSTTTSWVCCVCIDGQRSVKAALWVSEINLSTESYYGCDLVMLLLLSFKSEARLFFCFIIYEAMCFHNVFFLLLFGSSFYNYLTVRLNSTQTTSSKGIIKQIPF